ncbi:rCG63260 [Rattus norvegicus]|uniref:RCG63260 n=1 Tax=Rattus norvegicus TaxID=10116 RepID=A6JH02_RAT|nr:rCG63260 [Rattus norvegicus]
MRERTYTGRKSFEVQLGHNHRYHERIDLHWSPNILDEASQSRGDKVGIPPCRTSCALWINVMEGASCCLE